MSDDITVENGYVYGPWCRPPNPHGAGQNSIHNDAVAQRLGFQGGWVSSVVLFEMFPPLMLKAFGHRWFERGSVSVYFFEPILDREEVRVVMGIPPEGAKDAQMAIWIERPNGRKICEGTAAVGDPDAPSALKARNLDRYEPGELRILADVRAGDELPHVDAIITREQAESRNRPIAELLDWLKSDLPWEGEIATLGAMITLLGHTFGAHPGGLSRRAVIVYGGIELRNVNGPVEVGHPYRSDGTIINVGQSPKSEYLWYDSRLDESDGTRVAEMRMMWRFLKASSPLYQA